MQGLRKAPSAGDQCVSLGAGEPQRQRAALARTLGECRQRRCLYIMLSHPPRCLSFIDPRRQPKHEMHAGFVRAQFAAGGSSDSSTETTASQRSR